MTDTIPELLARVEACEGRNGDLDMDLALALGWSGAGHDIRDPDGVRRANFPALTASLDAALALVERVLPGFMWDLHFTLGSEPAYTANLLPPASEFQAVAKTPALALLAALLKAKIAEAASPEGLGVPQDAPKPPSKDSTMTGLQGDHMVSLDLSPGGRRGSRRKAQPHD